MTDRNNTLAEALRPFVQVNSIACTISDKSPWRVEVTAGDIRRAITALATLTRTDEAQS